MVSLSDLPYELHSAILLAGLAGAQSCLLECDETRVRLANQAFLHVASRVSRVWNDIATPLLYRTIVLSDSADPFLHPNRRYLLRTLYAHPNLRAHVREVHQSSSEEAYFEEEGLRTVWGVLPLLPAVERVGGFELKREYDGQENGVFKKGLETLSVKLYKRDADQHLSLSDSTTSTVGRPASSEGEVVYPSLARWFDLSTLVRLDIQACTVPQRLLPFFSSSSSSDLPQLVDLRLKGFSWRTDLDHVSAFLEIFGAQLRRLDLSTARGEEGVRFGVGRLDLLGLCGGLEILGLDGGSAAALDVSERQTSTTTTKGRSKVKTLLIGLSAGARAFHHWTAASGCSSTLRLTDLVARPWFEPLLQRLEPETVRLTDMDGHMGEDVVKWVGRRVKRKCRYGARVKDREGRLID